MPLHALLGLAILAISWTLNWSLTGPRTHLLFFPLWFGYVVTIDAIVYWRVGSSILTRSRRAFIALFFVSMPLWWLFELLNLRLRNWRYAGRELFSDVEYALLASIAFSTVVPAVFETADLWQTFRWTEKFAQRRPLHLSGSALFVIGVVLLIWMLIWPDIAYPLVWIALLFIVDPILRSSRRDSLLDHVARGDFRIPMTFAFGALTCGFFWEMWNWYSFPKWIYRTPGFEFAYLFEMPALGYLGYLPFGLEVYSITALCLPRDLFYRSRHAR